MAVNARDRQRLADELAHLLAELRRALLGILRVEEQRRAVASFLFVAHRDQRQRERGNTLGIDVAHLPAIDEIEIRVR